MPGGTRCLKCFFPTLAGPAFARNDADEPIYSVEARRNEFSPKKVNRDRHSSFTEGAVVS